MGMITTLMEMMEIAMPCGREWPLMVVKVTMVMMVMGMAMTMVMVVKDKDLVSRLSHELLCLLSPDGRHCYHPTDLV